MKRASVTKILLAAWIGALVTVYNACGGFRTTDSNSLFGDPVPVFEKTVHPLLLEHCSSCHGESVTPLFAAESAEEAFDQVQSSIDTQEPSRSRLVQKLLTQQHNCWSGSCQEDGEEMLRALESFVEQLGNQNEVDTRVLLGELDIPAEGVLPNQTDNPDTFQTLTWSLESVGAPGAEFTVDIQEFGPGMYRFVRPTLVNLPQNFWVKSIFLKLNGASRDLENSWNAVDIMDTELTTRQLSDTPLHVAMEKDADGNPISAKLEPAFEVLEGVGGFPRATPRFNSVQPMLTAMCTSCHSQGGGQRLLDSYDAVTGTPVDIDPNGDEITGKRVVVPSNFVDSILYQRVAASPGTPGAMPPNGGSVSQNDLNTLRDWILGGARQ